MEAGQKLLHMSLLGFLTLLVRLEPRFVPDGRPEQTPVNRRHPGANAGKASPPAFLPVPEAVLAPSRSRRGPRCVQLYAVIVYA